VATSTPRGYPHSRSVLTLYDGCLWQCSLHGRRLGFCMRGRSGLLSGWHGFLFRHCCGGFIPIPGQVRRFPAEYTIGCQLSTTIKPNVLLGKDLHLQARPDYRHGWGTEDAGDVDQSSLGRRLLLRLNSRLLFSSSGGWFSAPFTTGGWRVSCATSSSMVGARLRLPPAGPPLYPSRLRPPSLRGRKAEFPASNGVSLSAHYIETQVLDYPTQGSLPLEMWSS
jgi:hypothetical protein